MVTPLYWAYRDPDIGLNRKILFPFLYSSTSPRESNQAFFPFWGHFERYGISESTWITPFFNHKTDLRGWSTNLYPLVYVGRNALETHFVVAPVPLGTLPRRNRAPPWPSRCSGASATRRKSPSSSATSTITRRNCARGLDWEVHIFPAFSYGETPNGHWWNVLYGLAGYTRQGTATTLRTLWIPTKLSE